VSCDDWQCKQEREELTQRVEQLEQALRDAEHELDRIRNEALSGGDRDVIAESAHRGAVEAWRGIKGS